MELKDWSRYASAETAARCGLRIFIGSLVCRTVDGQSPAKATVRLSHEARRPSEGTKNHAVLSDRSSAQPPQSLHREDTS